MCNLYRMKYGKMLPANLARSTYKAEIEKVEKFREMYFASFLFSFVGLEWLLSDSD